MRLSLDDAGTTKIWLSANDTAAWCSRWPCSGFSGARLWVEFDQNGDLIDYARNGRSCQDIDEEALSAITTDALSVRFPDGHPAMRGDADPRSADLLR